MTKPETYSLNSLTKLRTAPFLEIHQYYELNKELKLYIDAADWFTIGIMAPSQIKALSALREMEKYFNWSEMKLISKASVDGSVYLKANQNTSAIHIRNESGLGEGILISCQYLKIEENTITIGPLPLDFFNKIA